MKSNKFSMSTGQAHELAQSFGRNGWNNEQIKKLCEGDLLRQVLDVLEGKREIVAIIDLDGSPFIPEGFTIYEHNKGGMLRLCKDTKLKLFLSKEQENQRVVGEDLYKEIKILPSLCPFNAILLDFYLQNYNFIPKEWKEKQVFFWGTIYRCKQNNTLCVRYLEAHTEGSWRWQWFSFTAGFSKKSPAVMFEKDMNTKVLFKQ